MPRLGAATSMFAAQILQSALAPAGPEAHANARMWWLLFWVTTIVFVIVIAFAAVAVVRGRRAAGDPRTREAAVEPALMRAVGIGVALTVVILFGILVASVIDDRATASLGAESALTIDVTGHQWWWEIEYEDAIPARHVRTANEIHIPVGRPVALKVTSHDVIHSFWVPNLQGKRDLIPGYTTAIWLQADRPGIYRGQCAEFCGRQHAHMAVAVIAESDDAFEQWRAGQLRPAREPGTPDERRGQQVFRSSQCVLCHAITGTDAGGLIGPDLTHLASRGTIAAGTLSNQRRQLADWVVDSQHVKPGNQMPPVPMGGNDLQALVTYLESLK